MKCTEKEQLENCTREFEKLLMMLSEKFPDAFKYYTERLRPPEDFDYIKRRGYYSDCKKASRHLYSTPDGVRVDYCVHCGKKKPKKYN